MKAHRSRYALRRRYGRALPGGIVAKGPVPKGRVPFYGAEHCYACRERPVGLRDRRPEGGELEPACKRHADPTIKTYDACMYCGGQVRSGKRGGVSIEGNFAHKSCHEEASR